MESLGRTLVILGALIALVGLVLLLAPSVPWGRSFGWLGRLPGDIRIERPGVRVYLPITTCLLVSAVLSALLWIASRWR